MHSSRVALRWEAAAKLVHFTPSVQDAAVQEISPELVNFVALPYERVEDLFVAERSVEDKTEEYKRAEAVLLEHSKVKTCIHPSLRKGFFFFFDLSSHTTTGLC